MFQALVINVYVFGLICFQSFAVDGVKIYIHREPVNQNDYVEQIFNRMDIPDFRRMHLKNSNIEIHNNLRSVVRNWIRDHEAKSKCKENVFDPNCEIKEKLTVGMQNEIKRHWAPQVTTPKPTSPRMRIPFQRGSSRHTGTRQDFSRSYPHDNGSGWKFSPNHGKVDNNYKMVLQNGVWKPIFKDLSQDIKLQEVPQQRNRIEKLENVFREDNFRTTHDTVDDEDLRILRKFQRLSDLKTAFSNRNFIVQADFKQIRREAPPKNVKFLINRDDLRSLSINLPESDTPKTKQHEATSVQGPSYIQKNSQPTAHATSDGDDHGPELEAANAASRTVKPVVGPSVATDSISPRNEDGWSQWLFCYWNKC